MNNIPLRRALLLALLSLVTGSAFATRAKARFDSTHFQDQGNVQVKVVATDEKNRTYSARWTGKAYNKGLCLWNGQAMYFDWPFYYGAKAHAAARLAYLGMNHSVTGGCYWTKPMIMGAIRDATAFHITTHGDGPNFKDGNNAEWVTAGDIAGGNILFPEQGVYGKTHSVGGPYPQYNLVVMQACSTLVDYWGDVTWELPGTGGFGVYPAEDRAYVGWMVDIPVRRLPGWSRLFYRRLQSGWPVALASYSGQKQPIPRVVGDHRTKMHGVYGAIGTGWIIED
jgi:hypothetical protein